MSGQFNFSKHQMEEKLKGLYHLSMKGDKEAYESFLSLSSVLIKKRLTYLGAKYESKESIEDILQEILISIHAKKPTHTDLLCWSETWTKTFKLVIAGEKA